MRISTTLEKIACIGIGWFAGDMLWARTMFTAPTLILCVLVFIFATAWEWKS